MTTTPLTWIEVNKEALEHNLAQYKSALGERELGIVVKSNAYGHGLLEIAKICQENSHAQWLFTATLSEAIGVRQQGITKPLLVLYFIDDNPQKALEYDISLMVCDTATLHNLNSIANKNNAKFKIHLKIDTGMSRFGFNPANALNFIKEALSLPGIFIEGLYSHFAQAANSDLSFTKEQELLFLQVLEELHRHHIEIPYKHIANSAGSTVLDSAITNLVRVGLGAYGWWPSQSNKELTQQKFPTFELKPVLTFKTRIFQINQVPANKCVGYDRTYKTSRPTTVAVLPVGYYDGYDRRLSSKGILLVREQYAPVIGIIAMTTTLVDITDIPNAKVGDEVVLMGNYDQITPTQLANVIGSFNAREIMTRLNPLLPRIII